MTTTTTDFQPGIYPDIPETDYHARRFGPPESLSSTEAKRVLKAPAIFQYARQHGQENMPAFDLGHVAHALVLGIGLPIYIHDHDNLRTKAAREDVEKHRAAGEVPISRADYNAMTELADAVLTHPVAGPLFEAGVPEASVFAKDSETGVWMRGRIDWYSTTTFDAPATLVDLKTAQSADPTTFHRAVTTYGYDIQREWYRTIWQMFTGESPQFLHVVVEKAPPHLVSVIDLGLDFEEIGRMLVRQALDTYRRCLDTDTWPGYAPIIHDVDAPSWYVTAAGLDDIEVA